MLGATAPKQGKLCQSSRLPIPSFPTLRSSLPNPAGEAEGLAQACGDGRNAVSARRHMPTQDAHAHPPPVSKIRRGSAPHPHTERWRYRAEAGKLPGRASRGCAVSLATLKRASCGVIPGARPWPSPADWEARRSAGWEILESHKDV